MATPSLAHTAHTAAGPAARLAAPELLVLLLHARGYTLEQIARVRGVAAADVEALLAGAARALGVATVREAITAARHRGLID